MKEEHEPAEHLDASSAETWWLRRETPKERTMKITISHMGREDGISLNFEPDQDKPGELVNQELADFMSGNFTDTPRTLVFVGTLLPAEPKVTT